MKLNIPKQYSEADPYVIKGKDGYYMYATDKEGAKVFYSENFFDWEYLGICYSKKGEKEYWAPCAIEIDGTYYLYVSSMPENEDDCHLQKIQVAKSNSPRGPFEFITFLTPPFSIDPHVVRSGKDLFMFYSTNDYDAVRAGTLIVVDKMVSPTEMVGQPKVMVRATLDEEIFMKDRFKMGQHWHTLEGAFYLRKGDYHYLMYSGNCYQNEKYYIGYAYAYSKEDDLTKLKFQKYPDENTYYPLICKNEFEEGTGHHSVLEVNGKLYVIYHGRDYGPNQREGDQRTARICEISLDKERIKVVKR